MDTNKFLFRWCRIMFFNSDFQLKLTWIQWKVVCIYKNVENRFNILHLTKQQKLGFWEPKISCWCISFECFITEIFGYCTHHTKFNNNGAKTHTITYNGFCSGLLSVSKKRNIYIYSNFYWHCTEYKKITKNNNNKKKKTQKKTKSSNTKHCRNRSTTMTTEKEHSKRRWKKGTKHLMYKDSFRDYYSIASIIFAAIRIVHQTAAVCRSAQCISSSCILFRFIFIFPLFSLQFRLCCFSYQTQCSRWFHCIYFFYFFWNLGCVAFRNMHQIDTCSSSLNTVLFLLSTRYE